MRAAAAIMPALRDMWGPRRTVTDYSTVQVLTELTAQSEAQRLTDSISRIHQKNASRK